MTDPFNGLFPLDPAWSSRYEDLLHAMHRYFCACPACECGYIFETQNHVCADCQAGEHVVIPPEPD